MRVIASKWSALIERLEAADLETAALDDVRALVGDVSRAQAWLESVLVRASARLRRLAIGGAPISPVHTLAGAGGLDVRPADQIVRRADTLGQAPALAQCLEAGAASAAHVDVLGQTLRTLDPPEQARFLDRQDKFAAVAQRTTPSEFKRYLAGEAQRVRRNDGLEAFQRRCRDTRLRTWWGRDDGMFHVRGQFDPESGQLLDAAITQRVESLFHATHPPTTPTDPVERHAHLQAHALSHLVVNSGDRRSACTNVHVLIDLETLRHGLHQRSVVEGHTSGAELPVATVRRLACDAGIIPVVLNGHGVALDVGRAQRLATPAQRAALRASYPSCALCDAPFAHCTIHHLRPWDSGGPTNIANLVPLCSLHHHAAHEGGWTLALDPDTRDLTVARPDGTRSTHSIPRVPSGGVGAGGISRPPDMLGPPEVVGSLRGSSGTLDLARPESPRGPPGG